MNSQKLWLPAQDQVWRGNEFLNPDQQSRSCGQEMYSREGRVSFLQWYSCWQVSHAHVAHPIPRNVWIALIGFSGLLKKKKKENDIVGHRRSGVFGKI